MLSLYTGLLVRNQISPKNYNTVKSNLEEAFRLHEQEQAKLKPINSPLFINTLQSALYGGLINEYDFCKSLNIKADKIDQYIE